MLLPRLEEMEALGKLDYTLVLRNPPNDWEDGLSGELTQEMLKERLFEPSDDNFILTCGPPEVNQLAKDLLIEVGHKEDNLFQF